MLVQPRGENALSGLKLSKGEGGHKNEARFFTEVPGAMMTGNEIIGKNRSSD